MYEWNYYICVSEISMFSLILEPHGYVLCLQLNIILYVSIERRTFTITLLILYAKFIMCFVYANVFLFILMH